VTTPSNKSIIKAIDLVELVCGAPNGLSLREAALAAHLPVATTHRLLTTLKSAGAIRSGADGLYTLGPRLIALHEREARARDAVRRAIEDHLAEMLTGPPSRSLRFSVLDATELLIYAGVDNGVDPKMRSQVGARYEAYCTAPGKVLLAGLSGRKLEDYVFGAGFVPLTPNTITMPSRLAGELKRVCSSGYALDDGEFIAGVRCLAVPVRLGEGQVIAALSVAGEELPLQTIPRLAADLAASAAVLAAKLECIPGSLRALHDPRDRL